MAAPLTEPQVGHTHVVAHYWEGKITYSQKIKDIVINKYIVFFIAETWIQLGFLSAIRKGWASFIVFTNTKV